MKINPYIMTDWIDHILDVEYGEVIQEGTRFTAKRANNIEEGIFNSYAYLKAYYDEMTKLKLQVEMMGRSPINNGTFFDPMDDSGNSKSLTLLKDFAVLQIATEVGGLEIVIDKEEVFHVGEYITIFDDENMGDVIVESISEKTLTVSILGKPFKKGAMVVRSSALVDDGKLDYGEWGNYTIDIKEVI